MLNKNGKIKPNYAFIDGQNLYQSIKEQNWDKPINIDNVEFKYFLEQQNITIGD